MSSGFTPEQIEQGISSALKAGDMPSVVSLLHLLAVEAPKRAETVLAAIEIAGGIS
jgi:protein involved in polysaccharide export with SLBB domain